jgi:hypothetical protein
VIVERFAHAAKHFSEIVSTDRGMQMNKTDSAARNAEGPNRTTCDGSSEPDWLTIESSSHPEKHFSSRIATEEGMKMNRRDEQS